MDKLLKFQSVSHNAFSSLANGKLWFSSFYDFNDPFEGRFEFLPYPQSKPHISLFKKYISALEDRAKYDPSCYDLIDELKYEGFEFREFDWVYQIISEKLYESLRDDGCLCFSEFNQHSLKNQLMWSHYADGLRGFCIVFDQKELLSSLESETSPILCPVNYDNNFPKLDIVRHIDWVVDYISDPPEHGGEALTKGIGLDIKRTKARSWKYENEVRVLLENQSGLVRYDSSAIKEVIIGHKMLNNDAQYLRKIIRSLSEDIDIKIATIEQDSYELEIVDDWEN
ncbi:hypothetical protein ACSSVW_002082 [Pseudoalteromonas sp. MBR-15]|jgi:hypothetical protein